MRERFSTSKLPRATQDQVQVRILKCWNKLVVIELDLGFVEFMPLMMILRIELERHCRDAPHDSIDEIEQWRAGNVTYSEVRGWDAPSKTKLRIEKGLVANINAECVAAGDNVFDID